MQNGQAEGLPRPRHSSDSRHRTVPVGDEVSTHSDLDFEIPPSPVRPPSGFPSMIDDEDKYRSRSPQRLRRFSGSGESLRRRWIEGGGRPFSLEELRSRDQLEMVYPPQPQSLESTVDHLVERWFSFAIPTLVY